jgi:hypothetical protein
MIPVEGVVGVAGEGEVVVGVVQLRAEGEAVGSGLVTSEVGRELRVEASCCAVYDDSESQGTTDEWKSSSTRTSGPSLSTPSLCAP